MLSGRKRVRFEIALVYTSYSIVAVVIQIPVGRYFVDGWGRKKGIVVGGLASSLSVAILAFSKNPLLTAIAYVSWGAIGGSFTSLARSALIMDSVPKERLATGFGAFITLAGLIATISPLTGGFLILQGKLFIIFLVSAILTLGSAIVRAILLNTYA